MFKFVFLLSFLPSLVLADKLILGGFSEHHGSPVALNEFHPAIGIEKNNFEYAIYKNSIEKTSFAFSLIKKPFSVFSFDFGYRIGIATGYDDKPIKGYDARNYTDKLVFNGLKPQIQLIASKKVKNITIDAGFSIVSTITFKADL